MLKFTKMEGLGNDYVYIDVINQNVENPSELAEKVSDRHFGIGSDGLILIGKSDKADFKMNIYNPDGSQAEMCGNGIRCASKFVYEKGMTNKKSFTFETLAGVKKIDLTIENDKVTLVNVCMGEPILKVDKIPVTNYSKKNIDGAEFASVCILKKEFTCVSMGNPHAVCFTNDNSEVTKIGPIIENSKYFPNKTNVEFVHVINKNEINMRVWERGTGETLACGTGACAAVIASVLNGYTEREVNVNLLGGKLYVLWDKDNKIYMKGPAKTVFEGTIDI